MTTPPFRNDGSSARRWTISRPTFKTSFCYWTICSKSASFPSTNRPSSSSSRRSFTPCFFSRCCFRCTDSRPSGCRRPRRRRNPHRRKDRSSHFNRPNRSHPSPRNASHPHPTTTATTTMTPTNPHSHLPRLLDASNPAVLPPATRISPPPKPPSSDSASSRTPSPIRPCGDCSSRRRGIPSRPRRREGRSCGSRRGRRCRVRGPGRRTFGGRYDWRGGATRRATGRTRTRRSRRASTWADRRTVSGRIFRSTMCRSRRATSTTTIDASSSWHRDW
mmetsp:Transcript_14773/g.29740  ORF Transcript_14773/g.29740 Transcript_14773/m.29740 type:complete len:276 (+) Transcript_14773:738-1565(+)